jgi:hypothetical protein
MAPRIARRQLTRGLLVILAAPQATGCRHDLECTDTSQLSPADLELRTRTLAYVDKSPDPKQACASCQQFKPRGADKCGACVVLRGPIDPRGRCRKWAAKPA